MYLNQLYFDHQLLLIRGGDTSSRIGRAEHAFGASRLAARIGRFQRGLGAKAAPAWEALAAGSPHQQGCSS